MGFDPPFKKEASCIVSSWKISFHSYTNKTNFKYQDLYLSFSGAESGNAVML